MQLQSVHPCNDDDISADSFACLTAALMRSR